MIHWVFKLKNIFIDEHKINILKHYVCGLLSHSILFPATTISKGETTVPTDKASVSTARMPIPTNKNTIKDTRGIILKRYSEL